MTAAVASSAVDWPLGGPSQRRLSDTWLVEWNRAGAGTRWAVAGHVLWPSRWARGGPRPTHWYCGLCLREFRTGEWGGGVLRHGWCRVGAPGKAKA